MFRNGLQNKVKISIVIIDWDTYLGLLFWYWSGCRGFFFFLLPLPLRYATAKSSDSIITKFLSMFSNSRCIAGQNFNDLYGWPWPVTLTFPYKNILWCPCVFHGTPRAFHRHHRFSMEHNECDTVHYGTPWGFHTAPYAWFFHGVPWDIDGTWDTKAWAYPCCPIPVRIKTCLLQSCTYISTFKYEFRVPVYSSSALSLLVNSISMSLV